jgi:hypothetical protein
VLSKRELARRVGVSHVAIITGRISPETNAKVLAVLEAEQARVEGEQQALRLGRSMQMELQQVL